MEKVVPDGKVKELFCFEVNREERYTKGIGVTESGKYYIIESHEYNIGSAYSYYSDYYPIEPDEVSYYQRVAEGRKKAEEFRRLEEECARVEDRERLLTNNSDRKAHSSAERDL